MAILDSGTLGGLPTVEKCRGLPALAESFGVYDLSRLPSGSIFPAVPALELGSHTIEFYRHPELFVSDTARIWKAEYSKMKYCERKNYGETHPCFWYALEIYENMYEALKPKPMGLI